MYIRGIECRQEQSQWDRWSSPRPPPTNMYIHIVVDPWKGGREPPDPNERSPSMLGSSSFLSQEIWGLEGGGEGIFN